MIGVFRFFEKGVRGFEVIYQYSQVALLLDAGRKAGFTAFSIHVISSSSPLLPHQLAQLRRHVSM